jgi:hypothetical protein
MSFLSHPARSCLTWQAGQTASDLKKDHPFPSIQGFTGCCPNHFSLALKHFLIHLKRVPGDSKTRPSGSSSWNRFSFTSPRFIEAILNLQMSDF